MFINYAIYYDWIWCQTCILAHEYVLLMRKKTEHQSFSRPFINLRKPDNSAVKSIEISGSMYAT